VEHDIGPGRRSSRQLPIEEDGPGAIEVPQIPGTHVSMHGFPLSVLGFGGDEGVEEVRDLGSQIDR